MHGGFTRSIEEVVCPKHRGRFEPEASRAFYARSIASAFYER